MCEYPTCAKSDGDVSLAQLLQHVELTMPSTHPHATAVDWRPRRCCCPLANNAEHIDRGQVVVLVIIRPLAARGVLGQNIWGSDPSPSLGVNSDTGAVFSFFSF